MGKRMESILSGAMKHVPNEMILRRNISRNGEMSIATFDYRRVRKKGE